MEFGSRLYAHGNPHCNSNEDFRVKIHGCRICFANAVREASNGRADGYVIYGSTPWIIQHLFLDLFKRPDFIGADLVPHY